MSYKKRIFDSIDQTIGNTPMVKLNNIKKKFNLSGNIIAKLEFFNPLGSVKDRIGLAMIDEAERANQIDSDSILIEATSGNTGIALAFICAARGYKLILTMPNSMSIERRKMLNFLGAKLVLTPKELGMNGAIEEAKKIHKKTKNSLILDQFINKANPDIHFRTTAKEIWNDTQGKIDFFIAGVGTGGTISGVGKYLKEKKKNIKINCVSPGFIKSEMTDKINENFKQSLQEKISLNRFGLPEDVANAVIFLSSSMSDYITGETIHVNGGMYFS